MFSPNNFQVTNSNRNSNTMSNLMYAYNTVIANLAVTVSEVIDELVLTDELRESIIASLDKEVVKQYRLSHETDLIMSEECTEDYMLPDNFWWD